MIANTSAKPEQSRHVIHMEQRKQLQIAGVSDVSSFHETEIILAVGTETLILTGSGLHVDKLLLDEGKVEVNGHIDSLVYEKPKAIRRLFGRYRKK